MKNKLSEDFIKQFQTQTNQKLMNDTIEFLISSTKIDLPKDFLTKWIQLNSEKKITLDEAKLKDIFIAKIVTSAEIHCFIMVLAFWASKK